MEVVLSLTYTINTKLTLPQTDWQDSQMILTNGGRTWVINVNVREKGK